MFFFITVVYVALSAYRHQVIDVVGGCITADPSPVYVVDVYCSCSADLAGNEVVKHVSEVLHIYIGMLLHSFSS